MMASPHNQRLPIWANVAAAIIIPAGSVVVGLVLAFALLWMYDYFWRQFYNGPVPSTAMLGFKVASGFIMVAAPATAVFLDYLITRMGKMPMAITMPAAFVLLLPSEWLVVGL
ncbi:MAG TPA: hypothetical protein VFT91_08425, partial [Dehalococcoidia bacterium]|nr:hypothetical protein [Dehalococcoidia bacterium]